MSTGSGENAQAPRPRGGGSVILWVVLVISLAANAFFIGALVRWSVFQRPRPVGDVVMSPRAFWSDLSPSSRQLLLRELRAGHAKMAERYAALVASRRAEVAALRAQPFDPDAYRKALQASADVDHQARQQVIEFFVKVVSQLTPEERQNLASRLETRISNPPRRRARGPWAGGESPAESPLPAQPQPRASNAPAAAAPTQPQDVPAPPAP